MAECRGPCDFGGLCERDYGEQLDIELLPAPLPPLPRPAYVEKNSESACGCSLVLCLVTTFVALTVAMTSTVQPTWRWTIVALICAEAVIALLSLAGLMFDDPGVIRRTSSTCLPIPAEVEQRLREGAPLREGPGQGVAFSAQPRIQNIRDGARSYCVRCCVWRDHAPPPTAPSLCRTYCGFAPRNQQVPVSSGGGAVDVVASAEYNSAGIPRPQNDDCDCCGDAPPSEIVCHHCSTCQRCVRYFDHHCGVFGRCIAGKGLEGNMKYFITIISMGYAGGLTCAVGVIMGLVNNRPQ